MAGQSPQTEGMKNMAPILKRLSLLGAILALSACKLEVLAPSGDVAAQQRDLLVISTLLMLIIIIPVMALTIWFAWRYRSANRDATYDPDWDHSTKLELVIWAIPLLIIVCLGALTWVGTHLLDPYRPLDRISATEPARDEQPLRVQVVALDWKWLFIYPDEGVASVNQMAVPVDRPVEFTLTSSSVMNAFYIPAMAGMIYAMPGMQTTLHGVFNEAGEYQGIGSHYSGAGFSGMRFKAIAYEDGGFEDWIAKARDSGESLDRNRYLELEVPSENVPPMAFAEVEPRLFQRAVNMCVEDGKMCMSEMMAIDDQGGMGLSGTVNVAALTYDKYQRRGTARPILGLEPFRVVGICTADELEQMFAFADAASSYTPRDVSPLRGRGMQAPQGLFGESPPADFTLSTPADAGAERNL